MTRTPGSTLGSRFTLSRQILQSHYNAPATALWRVFEVEVVLDRLRGQGLGLDLGCGDGELASLILSHTGMRWTGLEIDEHDVELARRRGVYAEVKHALASHIPEPDASFDLVFSNSALEHMEPLEQVLAEVARVLRPGGRFIFTVPTPAFDDLLLWRRVLHAVGFERLAERYRTAMDRRLLHRNLLTPDQWRDTLAAHGLETLEMLPYLTARAIAVWELLSNATGGLAWLVTGGVHPREIQRKAGMLRGPSAVAGAVASIALFPALALASAGERNQTGALYVEAQRA